MVTEEEIELNETTELATYSRYTSNKLWSRYFTKYSDNSYDIYRGDTRYDSENRMIRTGEGQMIYQNGVIYEGTWDNDKPKHVNIYIKDTVFSRMVVEWMGFEDQF